MTLMTKPMFAAALVAALAYAPAAQAGQSKGGSSNLKSKCTVAAVVVGTGWDIFGGSSSCSMLNEKDKSDAAGTKPQVQTALPVKSKR